MIVTEVGSVLRCPLPGIVCRRKYQTLLIGIGIEMLLQDLQGRHGKLLGRGEEKGMVGGLGAWRSSGLVETLLHILCEGLVSDGIVGEQRLMRSK